MNQSQAIELIDCIERADQHFNDLIRLSKTLSEEEGRSIRRKFAATISDIYEKIEIPIYSKFPTLPNRRDK